jgi:hypothetical protein
MCSCIYGSVFSDISKEIQGPLKIGRDVISKRRNSHLHVEKGFGTFGNRTKASSVK